MSTRLIIARHGNTFRPGDTITRVGASTDLPLVETQKGTAIGRYLRETGWIPSVIISSPLRRTMETARLAADAAGIDPTHIISDERFREIDYGPDENKPEDAVIARIGQAAMDAWNCDAIVPHGWEVSPVEIEQTWLALSRELESDYTNQTVLVVTSNGIARFAPVLTEGGIDAFKIRRQLAHLKIGTGRLSVFEKSSSDNYWQCVDWNRLPDN